QVAVALGQAGAGEDRYGPRRARRWFGHTVPYGFSCAATGTLGSAEFSHSTKTSLYGLPEAAFTHWPPMMGVATTLALGPLPDCRLPTGVSTCRLPIALARPALSLGSDAACSAAAPASNRAMLAPSCWVHCLPAELWYPSDRSFEDRFVNDDLYG